MADVPAVNYARVRAAAALVGAELEAERRARVAAAGRPSCGIPGCIRRVVDRFLQGHRCATHAPPAPARTWVTPERPPRRVRQYGHYLRRSDDDAPEWLHKQRAQIAAATRSRS